ncbi:MAG: tetratricopeptide repeat protein, partial [Gammaproteobacteria bacterium]
LIDAATGYHLWSERYDRDLQDIFAVQDEVNRKIVAALEIKLTTQEQARVRKLPTVHLDAYDYFLRGLEHHARRTEEANALARQMFERAIDLDPNFAAAYAMLGRTYLMALAFQWGDSADASARLRAAAMQAVALDETLSIAHETLAYSALGGRQFDEAIAAAERAIDLDPNSADALITLGEVLSFAGRANEGVPLVERAMRLNPQYPPAYLWALGQTYYFSGRTEEAIVAFNRVITRNPDHITAHLLLAVTYTEVDRLDDAHKEIAEILRINPSYSLAHVRERSPYKDLATRGRMISALERAGLT